MGGVSNRGERVLAYLDRNQLMTSQDIQKAAWLSISDLRLFHTNSYLDSISHPETLARIFGLEPHEVNVDELLTSQRRASSGTLEAMVEALAGSHPIGLNLGGGFHHAEPEEGSGFCIFNDVALGIFKLRKDGFQGPVSIVDLDYHQGNGNNVAFAEDPTVSVYSIHGSVWSHLKGENDYNYHLSDGTQDQDYLNTLRETLPPVLNSHKPELLVYLAGNDVLEGDPLGGFRISLKGLYDRDRFVVDWAQKNTVPLVILLAGGYSYNAALGTVNLLSYILLNKKKPLFKIEKDLHGRFTQISHELDLGELQKEGEEDWKFSEEDIVGELGSKKKHHRLLDFYSAHGIEMALESYGVMKKVRDLGYESLRLELDLDDPSHQMVRFTGKHKDEDTGKRFLLAEIVLRKEELIHPDPRRPEDKIKLLSVEWLLLQDPMKPFSANYPRFPGQEHPGLGIAEEAQEVFVQMGLRIKFDGILSRPSFFHIGAGAWPNYRFLDPKEEGRFQAMQEVLKDQGLVAATQLVAEKRLELDNGTKIEWTAADQVYPINQDLKDYFESRLYDDAVMEEKYRLLESGLHVAPGGGEQS